MSAAADAFSDYEIAENGVHLSFVSATTLASMSYLKNLYRTQIRFREALLIMSLQSVLLRTNNLNRILESGDSAGVCLRHFAFLDQNIRRSKRLGTRRCSNPI